MIATIMQAVSRKPRPPASRPLDEATLRLPNFTTGSRARGVMLANGQTWMIPKPFLELRPEISPTGELTGFTGVPTYGDGGTKSFGPEYIDLIAGAARSETAYERLNTSFKVGAFLLRQNYDLRGDELARLLPRVIDSDENDEMWAQLLEVIGGASPKPEADGPDSSGSAPSADDWTDQ